MNYDRPELRDRLAAEYVLGTLHGRARKRYQRLMRDDFKTRAEVMRWEKRLMPMGTSLSEPAPAEHIWRGIENRIARGTEARHDAQPGWLERWFGLRTLAPLVAGIVVGVMAMLSTTQFDDVTRVAVPKGRVLPESYAGILQNEKGVPTILISSLRNGRTVDIKVLNPIKLGADQGLQLWAITKDGKPFSLGAIPAEGKSQIELPGTSEQLLANVTELAVSIERRGAPPATTPSQPYVLRGPCAKFW
jgi:anti-sigma-K factor RskA